MMRKLRFSQEWDEESRQTRFLYGSLGRQQNMFNTVYQSLRILIRWIIFKNQLRFRNVTLITHRELKIFSSLWITQLRVPTTHGGLYRWRENSLPFLLYQKLKEILTRYSRTILEASKDWLISKIWRVWLKNWAHHGRFNF